MQNDLFEQIRQRVDVPDLCDRLGLDVRHKKIRCPNPQHDDAHPSCAVYEDGCHCYSCGYHADAVQLVQTVKGFSAPLDAAEWIAGQYGIDYEKRGRSSHHQKHKPSTPTAAQMRRHLKDWHQIAFRELRAMREECSRILHTYEPGTEDTRFFATLRIREWANNIMDMLVTPTDAELSEIFEEQGDDINDAVRRFRNSFRHGENSETGTGNGYGDQSKG